MRRTISRLTVEYVIITPARNEEGHIERTIASMVRQTRLPLRWVIVSDGSTDGTDRIASAAAAAHPWIEFIRMPEQTTRDFASKVRSFNAGFACVRALSYDVIGSIDADLSFPPDYFEFLLARFAADQQLGLAGTPFSEDGLTYNYRFSSTDHVSGACQLFRRECFESIGGYVAVKGGGIDVIAVLSARMNGWRTQTFVERTSVHHRPMCSANYQSRLQANFKLGQRAYALGFHPVWQVFRSVYQMTRRPYVTGGCALSVGYFWSMVRRVPRPVSRELIEFQQRDQMRRLRAFFGRRAAAPAGIEDAAADQKHLYAK